MYSRLVVSLGMIALLCLSAWSEEVKQPVPGDGFDGLVSRDDLLRHRLESIGGDHEWDFSDTRFVLRGDQALPRELTRVLTGTNSNVQQIEGTWRIDGKNLVLGEIRSNGQLAKSRVMLDLRPTGPVRFTIGSEQYNAYPKESQHTVATAASQRVALVIGNSKYGGEAALRNPANDADVMEATLQELGFLVIKRKDLNLAQMEDALVAFRRALTKGSLGLFFYAGHGMEVKGENFLVPIGARLREEFEVKRQCLQVDGVLEAMNESESNLKVVVLDCCRDNPFQRSWKRSGSGGGLAAMSSIPDGTLIAFATAAEKTAADGRGNNSPFTEQLAATLRGRPAEGLEIVDVFRTASQQVKQQTGQVPWMNLEASLPKYYLWRGVGTQRPMPVDNPVSPSDPLEKEVAALISRAKHDEAIRILDKRIAAAPTDSLAFAHRAWAHAWKDDLDRAMADAQRAVELDSQSAFAYAIRGEVLAERQQFDEAFADFDQALTLEPDCVRALRNRAAARMLLNEFTPAIEDFSQALRLDANNASLLTERSDAYLASGDSTRAMADIRKAISCDPTDATAYQQQALIYASQKQFTEALESLGRALELDSTDPESWTIRGDLYYLDLQEVQKAIEDYTEAIRLVSESDASLDPSTAVLYHRRGIAHVNASEFDKAVADFTEAIRRDAQASRLYLDRGNAYRLQSQHQNALLDLNQAIALDDSDPDSFNVRADVFAALGRLEAAEADRQKANELRLQDDSHSAAGEGNLVPPPDAAIPHPPVLNELPKSAPTSPMEPAADGPGAAKSPKKQRTDPTRESKKKATHQEA